MGSTKSHDEIPILEPTQEVNIINETPINHYDNFMNSFDVKIKQHVKIKQFYESLEIGNENHDKIKLMIIECDQLSISILKKHEIITQYIFNEQISDCIIILPNNETIKCLKIMLKRIKYFSLLLEEFKYQDDITLLTDPKITLLLIKFLYNFDIKICINSSNFCEIFDLMQLWLMDLEYIIEVLLFAESNVVSIITYQLGQQHFDNILILDEHLNNIYYSNCPKNIKKITQNITKQIYLYNFGENMFKFKNWQSKFSDELKLHTIKTFKRHDLLWSSKIEYPIIIKYLNECDFENNNIYCEIYDKSLVSNKVAIRMSPADSIKDLDKINSILTIESYDPFLVVSFLEKFKVTIKESSTDTITIKFDEQSFGKLHCNSRIIFDDMLKLNYNQIKTHRYTVIGIDGIKNGKTAVVATARYPIDTTMCYLIILDKPIKLNKQLLKKSNIWIYTEICHKIPHI